MSEIEKKNKEKTPAALMKKSSQNLNNLIITLQTEQNSKNPAAIPASTNKKPVTPNINLNQEIVSSNTTANIIPDQSFTFNDILKIKECFCKDLKELEDDYSNKFSFIKEELSERINTLNKMLTSLTDKVNGYSDYFNIVINNEQRIIELLKFKKFAEDKLITIELKQNSIASELKDAIFKYDKTIVENLYCPGFIGKGCKYKNFKEFIINTSKRLSNLDYFRDKFQTTLTENKTSLDNTVKAVNYSLNNFRENCNNYSDRIRNDLDSKIEMLRGMVNEKVTGLKDESEKQNKNIENIAKKSNTDLAQFINVKSELQKKMDDILLKSNENLKNFEKINQGLNKEVLSLKKKIEYINKKTDQNNLINRLSKPSSKSQHFRRDNYNILNFRPGSSTNAINETNSENIEPTSFVGNYSNGLNHGFNSNNNNSPPIKKFNKQTTTFTSTSKISFKNSEDTVPSFKNDNNNTEKRSRIMSVDETKNNTLRLSKVKDEKKVNFADNSNTLRKSIKDEKVKQKKKIKKPVESFIHAYIQGKYNDVIKTTNKTLAEILYENYHKIKNNKSYQSKILRNKINLRQKNPVFKFNNIQSISKTNTIMDTSHNDNENKKLDLSIDLGCKLELEEDNNFKENNNKKDNISISNDQSNLSCINNKNNHLVKQYNSNVVPDSIEDNIYKAILQKSNSDKDIHFIKNSHREVQESKKENIIKKEEEPNNIENEEEPQILIVANQNSSKTLFSNPLIKNSTISNQNYSNTTISNQNCLGTNILNQNYSNTNISNLNYSNINISSQTSTKSIGINTLETNNQSKIPEKHNSVLSGEINTKNQNIKIPRIFPSEKILKSKSKIILENEENKGKEEIEEDNYYQKLTNSHKKSKHYISRTNESFSQYLIGSESFRTLQNKAPIYINSENDSLTERLYSNKILNLKNEININKNFSSKLPEIINSENYVEQKKMIEKYKNKNKEIALRNPLDPLMFNMTNYQKKMINNNNDQSLLIFNQNRCNNNNKKIANKFVTNN